MTQDMNHTIVKVFRAVFVATMMLTSGNAMADGVVVKGNVYGGGNAADVGANATVNISGGQIGDNQIDGDHGNVFGGGKGPTTTVVGKVEVNIGKKVVVENNVATVTYSDNGTVKGSVYGGSAFGAVNGTKGTDWDEDNLDKISLTSDDMTTAVNIYAGTVNGNVYGGGRGEKTSSSDIAAKSFGAVTVIIGDANVNMNITVDGNVYGGSDVNGVLKNNVRVDVFRGTIGKSTTENGTTTITGGNVYGGGLGLPTLVQGSVMVNIGAPGTTPTGTANILGDVYGGSAKGKVNATKGGTAENPTYSNPNSKTTQVNLYSNTGVRDVYGGGHGLDGASADVYGDVTVNIGATDGASTPTYTGNATINGSVFGCNNASGSPQGDVTVNVYKTAQTEKEAAAYTSSDATYAIDQVFGGGNEASYTPLGTTNKAQVHIFTCLNTVKTVYGGGNAANGTNVGVTIDGGRFNRVFGGGNGEDSSKPAANISGSAITQVHGGRYDQVFGGSNSRGDVNSASLTLDNTSSCGDLVINNSFGGANAAEITGDVETTLICSSDPNSTFSIGSFYGGSNQADIKGNVTLNVYGGTYENVFGGSKGTSSKAANIVDNPNTTDVTEGNVTLNLYGGTITNAFGGSDVNGNITGKITINVLDYQSNTCPLSVTNIYGAGNLTAYTPNEVNNNVITSPEVNVIHMKDGSSITGSVYGGGKGDADHNALVTANPIVNIGYDATTMSSLIPTDFLTTANLSSIDDLIATVSGNVYGGGDLAGVTGNTTVYLRKANTSVGGSLFGGGNEAVVSGNTAVNVDNGTVTQDVYGGGALANVGTNASNTTQVTITDGTITGDVYGGGLGRLSIAAVLYTAEDAEVIAGTKQVGDVKEGAKEAIAALVNGAVTVNVNGGTVNEVFGCNNLNGAPQSTVEVNITNGTITNVFGGGNQAAYTGTPDVNVSGGTIAKVFGGGNEAGVGGSDVAITAGTISGGVYGGCNTSGTITGNTTVTLTGGTIGTSSVPAEVCGGGLGKDTKVTNSSTPCTSYVYVGTATDVADANTYTGSTTLYGDIYGGSAYGEVDNTVVNLFKLDGTSFGYNVFGGGKGNYVNAESEDNIEAKVNRTATVNMYALTIAGTDDAAAVYGGCNVNGTAHAAIVNLIAGTIGTSGTEANKVFGGGKGHETTTNAATVNVGTSATVGTTNVYSNVYGGSALGAVGTSIVNLNKATTLAGDVYGGGMGSGTTVATAATVTTSATVNQEGITLADTKNIYGGCNENGTAAATVVNLKGGSVYDVYGGGRGQYTSVTNDVEVNVGTYDSTNGLAGNPTVTHDVYGGSAQGSVNDADQNNTTKTKTTTVHLYAGKVQGSVYGGGLGVKAVAADSEHGIAAVTGIPAQVYGDVLVDLNNHGGMCYVAGNIFGCNNQNGAPAGTAEVHIYKTVHLESGVASNTDPGTGNYELLAVYGGGNEASSSGGTKVVIDTCDPSIQTVYGGGNAADVGSTDVTVNGAYEIGTLFGGGNGSDPNKPGANVNGQAKATLHGGKIHVVYGGSNENGDITGGTYVDISDASSTCVLDVGEIYGAGNNAGMQGGANIIMGCQPNSVIEDVYAGAKNADVGGNVSLTITSGKFGRVFGGNKFGGLLRGSITVNIEESGEGCGTPIVIGELYGGGNLADYSVYGYDTNGKAIETGTSKTYSDPQLNIRSFTSIGAVYGGGFRALMVADPTVNINVVKGSHYNDNDLIAGSFNGIKIHKKNTNGTIVEDGTVNLDYPAHAKGAIGTIGNVFGGGNEAKLVGSATVNIGTESSIGLIKEPTHLIPSGSTSYPKNADTGKYDVAVEGANITGNVYGGGNQADITGNTQVNICAKYNSTTAKWESVTYGTGLTGVTIGSAGINDDDHGNVYGGGKGLADNFLCNKAMVGTNDAGLQAGYSDGNTSVIIGNGTVNGNVYGGGEIGRVEMNTTVTIGLPGEGTSSPDIKGDVFGGGKGDKEHGYAGLVRGNPTVTIQANAKVEHNVYGGGEIASVARYKVPRNEDDLATAHSEGYIDAVIGRPYALKDANSGFCTVTVRGNAVIGPDYAMEMTKAGGPDDAGHVFGAGKGIMPENYDYASNTVEHKPRCRANDDSWTWFADIDEYIAFIQTLALSSQTTVNIGDANDSNSKPFVKGSVYGGSENGLVQFDTNVNIIGGQIGCGKNANGQPHPDGIWADNYVPDGTDYECASWNYGKVEVNGDNRKTIYAPYDPFANAEGDLDKYPQVGTQAAKSTEGGRRIATDGHTYYGNVFGGGSGSVPYFDTTEGISKYLNSAGTVKGNTNVTISGGHILTSVYGGCEATNVLGTANVTMTGGTIGVPRKDEQILAHPVTCNLFGAGKGDQRVFFNKDTNVENAVIQINGGRIYGSVFGGGEDGHVMKNVTLTIEEKNNKTVKIGSAGTSYMDGNVFGGGRGFGGDALTAGNVGGTVTLNIKSGSVLGSVYGGGRLASVGYGLYLTTETGFGENHDDGYGKMQEDGYSDWTKGDNNEYTRTAISGFKRGYINVNISGGTIGNTVANAQYGGNVFGGSMGSIVKQDGTVNTQWDKFATAKKTTVNVTGGTIMRSVYGGGEMGTVTTDAIVNVSGGTIGDANHGGAEFGNVYGGGKGYVDPAGINYIEAGIIKGNTNVTISETDATKPTTIYHNVYGGGAYGSVGTITRNDANYVHVPGQTSVSDMPESWAENTGSSEVRVLGGTIGRNGNENGMVFGSSRGDVGAPGEIHDKLAWVKKAKVVIGATGTTGPNIKGSVYGSGENGHLFQDAVVEIHSGVVGIAEGEPIGSYTAGGASYPYRGNVFGGGCGTDKYYSNPTGVANPHDGKGDKYNPLAGIVLGDASVTMDGGTVVRNIYGAGAMGSVGTMTTDDNHLVISSGGKTTIDISGGTVGVDGIVRDDGNSNGNVFGAARGDKDTDQTDVALVKTTEVTISQAEGKTTYVWGNVYGGGETGDVGTYYTITEEGANKGTNAYLGGSGACVVEVTGGTVHHNVFGAGKGESSKYECKKAMVSSTDVTIDTNAKVNGNVYGGGEVGRVEYNTVVKIGSGAGAETGGTSKPEIGGSVYGAGAGLETHGYSALVRGNSTVTVEGNAKVNGNVYGGGEKATVGKYWVSLVAQDPNEDPPSGFPDGMPYKTRDGGICTVNIQGYAQVGPDAGGSENAGHVFGAGKGVEPSYSAGVSKRMKNGNTWETFSGATGEADYLQFLETLALASVTNVTIDGNAKVKGSVYGGSESGFVQDEAYVTIKNGKIGSTTYGDIYGGGRGLSNFAEAGRVKGGVTIAVNGGTARGSVYGGGELGIVTGAVLVNINNGIIEKDVYGGGALANTNTNNWNGTTLTETYLEVGGLIAGTSSVAGYYTKSGDNYTLLATGTAVAGTKYYRKVNTTVNLLGGKIYGDAYGGGLGDLAARGTGHSNVAALVYGDVFVTLDGTAFDINKYEGKDIVKSGRVFGCNNLNGSPKGDVTVTVNKTVTTASGVKRTPEDPNNTGRPPMGEGVNVTRSYELAAVYGGGNLADYEAEGTGRKTHVIINSCDVSINQVYGGGNAAKVPETDVLVNGAYEIHQVFGGGNGADMYTLDNGASWKVNPGADIDGNANTLMKGGYIHEAYGGSNEKGTITGNITIDTGTGGLAACPVQVDKLVGAGKNADVNGNLIIILGCKDATKIPIVYGGADNAHVNGNVELTITSGRFGQVFGGNNLGGVIKGHIYLNIEETSDCEPIRIDDLYLGGNQAAYSRFGYYVETNDTKDGGSGVGANTETPVLSDDGKLILKPRVSATDTHLPVDTYALDANDKWTWTTTAIDAFKPYEQPVLNVTSCTSIGRVFGGGLGEGAAMYADPTVNINMIPGKHAEDQLGGEHKLGQIGIGYTDTNGQRVEGGVFGGGNEAAVYGNTTVNIGTEKTVKLHLSVVDANTGEYTMSEAKNVEGANILSNVYGGGNEADVTGNTYVNVCAKEADDASTADVIEYKGVTISGTDYEGVTIAGNVFGGGKGIADSFTCAKAMIGVDKENDGKTDITKESTNKGTRVSIGNGTVNGTVYGGGEIGRVEWNTVVTIGLPVESGTSAPVIRGDVFGAGKGVESYGYAALVRGNTFVTVQADAKVGHSIYGGGEIASVGKYTIASAEYAASHPEIEEGMPYSLANQGSGYCNVIVRGNAEIGPDGMVMNNTTTGKPDDSGHVFGAGKGILPYENLATIECQTHPGEHHPGRMAPGNVWECYDGNEAKYLSFVETQALATQTDVTIDGNAFVKGSVYGGSENGHVQHDTHVTIAGGQIGAGEGMNERYTGWPTETEDITTSWKECAHWEYTPNDAAPWDPYAIYESEGKYYYDAAHTQYAEGGAKVGKDGHTFYGNVFGGGSGLLPYAPGKWHRASGSVGGNTLVNITGGHILTSVYGGNEQTDVGTYKKDSKGALVVPVSGGKCTINMTGGTLGVPRTAADAKAHPVTCYLFGAGKGDQRIFFNTWTNVINTEVNISGTARIYGSTFGGGEDGHVIDNAETNISGTAIIGTTGTSYVDGNVFGGGRGFSGDAQTAGTVGGNVEINISGGKMLGSVYGGGRLASVGTEFTAPNDPNYGQFREDDADGTYGHVTVNISGGTIGNTVGNAESGNVFGGSMGRLTLLDGTTINPIWPKMAQVKETTVTISGDAVIKRNVYGGGELGTVRDNATVTINGGTVNRDVYGAGYGSKDYETKTKIEVKVPKEGVTNPTSASDYDDVSYVFTPMIFAGCVGQNTYVNIAGGKVRKSVYGGGEMASVGIMDCRVKIDNNATDPVYTEGTDKYVYEHFHSHLDENNGFALSWPFHFENAPGYFGETHVNITGGRIGVANGDTDINTDNGDVYGGGKGIAGEYKNYVYCANVGSAEVTIDYPAGNTATPQNYMTNADIECIAGAVYGGAENGHVMGDTKLTLKNGLIGHSMYGGGSGKGTFSTTLLKIGSTSEHYTRDIYSFTAGKVFGNSTVEMSGGTVVRNVYGGGNMGSVGKGNYAGGADDYSTSGYGETLTGNLWDNANDYSKAFLGSGKCIVNITGGTVGYIDESDPSNSMYPWNSTASLPYGNVFGGCRGESAPNIVETPRYLYSPEFFVGYANETAVTIGKTDGSGPTILGSVYGGGMDGHIRRDASVTILGGEIGIPFTEANKTKVKTSDLNDIQWLARGNVYGSGSGIGKYKYDFDYDGKYESTVKYNNGRATVDTKEEDYSTSAGSVTRFTTVDIKGGTIHRNVYGGGSLSSIGAPKIGQSYDPYHPGDSEHSSEVGKQSLNKVTISGGHIGDADCLTSGYGGEVNGGSRGAMAFENSLANPASFANSVYTEVTISDDADVKGNVFGGGEAGIVKHDTEVKMQGGTVGNDLYGAGDMADVGGNTVVDMTGGTIKHDAFGGARGTADVAAEVKGNATVTLDGTKFIPAFDTNGILTGGRIFGANNVNGTPKGHVKVHVLQTVDSAKDPSVPLADRTTYDVGAVYGGGNNADYRPTSTSDFAEVIIDGCEKTSIKYVFGGGNAAATPANDVKINGCYIIDNVFGGGNGTVSPANVGYDETDYKTVGTAVTNLSGGYIHNVYGGSNNQGNILGGASVTNEKYTGPGCCETLQVEEIYGGGKQADMFGGAEIILGCMPNDWIGAIYAGAEHADIGGDIGLTLTSGKFDRVFGGNKSGGVIDGYIEVNIEENPECGTPIIIGELYGGGNEAAYTYPHLDKDPNYLSPRVNVRAFTSIGTIFGGGLGATATVTGNPLVNINEVAGGREYAGETRTLEDGTKVTLYERKADGKMGVIGTVFGGGNAAPVIGNPRVEIGTAAKQKMLSLQTKDADGKVIEVEKDVLGADIRGNVYGGGNNAAVTGDPKVVIGQEK